MIQLIIGEKGKGKTKHLLDKVNSAVSVASGNIVYLDKNKKHMYELKNKIRLIDVSEYPLYNTDEFLGFILGIVSQDHDLEQVYLDSFLVIGHVDPSELESVLKKVEKISERFKVDFVISMAIDGSELSDEMKSNVIVSL